MRKIIITIDGPAGSGKGKISQYISRKWNMNRLDSGIFYRRLAYFIQRNEINFSDERSVIKFVKKLNYLSSRNNKYLRSEKISKLSSKIAGIKEVRNFVNKQQRILVFKNLHKKGYVVDGRDMGSVVFKNADLKLYIEVNEEIRAKRRHKQLIDMGEKSIYPKILKEIKLRDKIDIKRKHSPLVVPKGAFLINNSGTFHLTIKNINNLISKVI